MFSVNPIQTDVSFPQNSRGGGGGLYKSITFDNFWTALGLYFKNQQNIQIFIAKSRYLENVAKTRNAGNMINSYWQNLILLIKI